MTDAATGAATDAVTDPGRSPVDEGEGESVRVRVWDLPTRLVHWLVAILFAVSWWTAETDRLQWHRLSGYAVLALVLFRLYWGFAGSTTARFAAFLRGPRAFGAYARGLLDRAGGRMAGHNPMGGWSVVGLLGLLILQCGLGLFAVDIDGIESGPLSDLASFETGRAVAHLHGRVFNALLALVGIHLAAVAFYLVYKRDNLVAAMVGGFKHFPRDIEPALRFVGLRRALVGLALAALIVWGIVTRFNF